MKAALLIGGLFIAPFAVSCQRSEQTNEESTSQLAVSEPKTDAIVRDTVMNKDGVQLVMAYDNANHSATFMLNGNVIKLKQVTVASGIKYSNSEYEYTEHQGKMTLKKDGKVVFSNQ